MKNIRNFCIISHIDHGKSTLADRFLELTRAIPKEKMQPQYLDMMPLEREKGITIKMQPVRMEHNEYILNLIDTPGHVDFSYEVSRSLAAVEGAILLVDATKGIQAQTIANLELARRQNLAILPVINKIDMPTARIEEVKKEITQLLKIKEDEIFSISAKYGTNVEELLEAVIQKIPSPSNDKNQPLKALIFDSKYDPFKGVIAFVRVIDGEIKNNEKIYLMAVKIEGKVKEVGYFIPDFYPKETLTAGEIGYIATGIKEPGKVRVGDTITIQSLKYKVTSFPGYIEPQSMVFASLYPENSDDYELLKDSLSKLKLNDASLVFEPESRETLGRGFRCGFLGNLHIEIVSERLHREFGLNLVISTPSVIYKIINQKNKEIFIYSAQDFPNPSEIKKIEEPWVKLKILTPTVYLGRVLDVLKEIQGKYLKTQYFGEDKQLLIYEIPLREMIIGFYDKIKGKTQGFASMNYEILEYRSADLVKLEILVAGKKEEAFSKVVLRENAFEIGKNLVKKLKEILPPQLFSVAIQAVIEGKIIARETIRPKRRDVIAPLYGGDYTRKRKLLERQKKGKKELKEKGELHIPPRVFLEILKG